jgi:hypothetical protein
MTVYANERMQAAGGLMPWLLERFLGWSIGDNHSLAKMLSQDHGYSYDNNNTYAFCPKNARVYSYGEQQQCLHQHGALRHDCTLALCRSTPYAWQMRHACLHQFTQQHVCACRTGLSHWNLLLSN